MTDRNAQPHPKGRRVQVLQLLRDASEPMSIAQIADQLSVHANTVRFHLDKLLDSGQVEQVASEPGAPGRPAMLFRASPGMDPMGPRHYRVLAEVLAATLSTDPDSRGGALDAGRQWGRKHTGRFIDTDINTDTDTATGTDTDTAGPTEPSDPADSVEHLIQLLDSLDFAPEQGYSGDDAQIALRSCPFLELAEDRSDVVCPIHLGLMQGAMESWGSSVTIDRLDAFVQPDLCVAHLAAVEAGGDYL